MAKTAFVQPFPRLLVILGVLCSAAPAFAQLEQLSPPPTSLTQDSSETGVVYHVPSLSRLFKETLTDFRQLPSRDTFIWLTIGAVAAFAGHPADGRVTSILSASQPLHETLETGAVVGGIPFQLGAAFATYALGRATDSPRVASVGADLFRAQLMAQATTHAIKYSVRRMRPDSTRFSFPSGHASVTFASATVLQRRFGWKAGIPAYAVASYVAASRVQMKRHYLSDVAFGAALGIVAGRTVTIGRGNARFALAPMGSPGGGGVAFNWMGKR
jgi:membrane-associated phospholipid phosphatase